MLVWAASVHAVGFQPGFIEQDIVAGAEKTPWQEAPQGHFVGNQKEKQSMGETATV
jgi:hypothetical protein